jgi:hypothetical protein
VTVEAPRTAKLSAVPRTPNWSAQREAAEREKIPSAKTARTLFIENTSTVYLHTACQTLPLKRFDYKL